MPSHSMTRIAPGSHGIGHGGCICARATTACAVSMWQCRVSARRFERTAAAAVARAGATEVDLLYWTAASWAAAIALGKDDPSLVAELPLVSALIDRALAVDADWDRGAIHSFLVTYEMARPDAVGSFDDRVAIARTHFDRAVALVAGQGRGTLCLLGRVRLPAEGGSRLFRPRCSRRR